MVPETTSSSDTVMDGSPPDDEPNLLVNAAIGGVAGIVLSFVPLSPALGGGIAGYLQGGEPKDGLTVGAIAGLIMLIPLVFIGMFAMLFLVGIPSGGQSVGIGILAFFLLLIGALYTVGLSALGAVLGIYLKREL